MCIGRMAIIGLMMTLSDLVRRHVCRLKFVIALFNRPDRRKCDQMKKHF